MTEKIAFSPLHRFNIRWILHFTISFYYKYRG